MFPITSLTASLGHNGNIDIFALALSPQAPQSQGATVFRIRQKRSAPQGRTRYATTSLGNSAG